MVKLKNITIDALRYYDKIGLLKPAYIDKHTGYRYYSSKQFFKIDLIKFCKTLDIPLAQIKSLVKNSNQEDILEFLTNQKKEIYLKIKEYDAMITQIDNITNRITEYNISKKEKGIYYKYLPQRNIVYLEYSGSPSGNDSLLAYSKLYNSIVNSNFHASYNGGFIYTINENNMSLEYMFECVNESSNSLNIPNKTLPSGTYLYKSFSANELEESLEEVLKEIREKEINSNYLINTYLITGEFNSDNALSELQIFLSDEYL